MKKTNLSDPATKGDLVSLEARIETKFDSRLERLEEKFRKYRDEVLNKLDFIVGELSTMREERAIANHQHSELSDKVDDHEKRITNLEQS